MNQRRSTLRRILCLLLVAAMLIPFAGCGKGKNTEARETEIPTEPADLVLTISEDLFLLDKQTILEIQVTCQEDVTGDIRIKDETDTIIALLENDGSGSLKTQIPFRRSTIGSGSLTAYTGEFTSEPVKYEVQPEVTEEMVETLFDISNDLGEFIAEIKFEDPYSENTLSEIKKYLESNEHVYRVEENNGVLLYQTIDGLMGSYGMGRRTEGYAGFSDSDDVFEKWKSGLDVSQLYIQSDIAPTSGKCINLCPSYTDLDATMKDHSDTANDIMTDVFGAENVIFSKDDDGRLLLGRGISQNVNF